MANAYNNILLGLKSAIGDRSLSYRWLDFRIRFTNKFIDPWYYPIKDFFWPHNVQKIRNTPRSWNDRSERIFHCCFSMFCDFVEREVGGIEEAQKYLEMLEAETEHRSEWWIAQYREMIFCYKWYNSINWSDPVPYPENGTWEQRLQWVKDHESFYDETCQAMMLKVLETRHAWWT